MQKTKQQNMTTRITQITKKAAAALRLGLAAALVLGASAVAAETADYVFKNGKVYTVDSKHPKAEAIAIKGKHISYVGSTEGVSAYIGDKTQVIDLQGQMLLPGFVEAHIHPTLAIFAQGADLQCDTVEEMLARVKSWADCTSECQGHPGLWLALLFVSDHRPNQGGSGQTVPRPAGTAGRH